MSKPQVSNFWSNYLGQVEELPSLPMRSAWEENKFTVSTNVIYEMKKDIDIDIDINHYCDNVGVTVPTLIHGIWAVLLSRYSGLEKVLFESNDESNSKPVVILVDENLKVKDYLLKVDANLSSVCSQETVNYNNIDTFKASISELTTLKILNEHIQEDIEREDSAFIRDLVVSFVISNNGKLSIEIISNNKREYRLKQIIEHFSNLLIEFTSNSELEVKKIQMMTDEELNKVIVNFNQNTTPYPSQSTIIKLFEEQVRKKPNNIAIVFNDEHISYEALNNRSNYLANRLIELGVNKGSSIGIITDRNPDLIISIIASLKVGCIYVPIDSEYPLERINYILRDSSPEVCIIHSKYSSLLDNIDSPKICVDEFNDKSNSNLNYKHELSPNDSAYINYTSGSTGKPKGVVITHRAVIRLVQNTNFVDLGDEDCFLQISSPTFDAATFEIWGALLNGGRLVMLPKETILDLRLLTQIIESYKVNSMFLTSALFNQIVVQYPESLSNVDNLVVGGDKLSISHIKQGLPYIKEGALVNGYGPTENTTFSCCYRVKEVPSDANSIPIGYPISNSKIYILDRYGRPCPIGVIGEIYTGGDGLAKGYLNKPDKTKELFITNPFKTNEKVYKTGDLGRWLPNGIVEFSGRKDFQVKIRGYRIELGEIENVILSFRGIKDCVVLALTDENSNKRLVAYYTTKNKISVNDVREWIKSKLPNYMIPSLFIELEEFPLTSHGKLDRKALEKRQELNNLDHDDKEQEFRSQVEITLLNIWKEILGFNVIGPYDNFFEIGGDSILLMKLQGLIIQRFGQTLSLVELLEHTNIRSLSMFIEQGTKQNLLESRIRRRIMMKSK